MKPSTANAISAILAAGALAACGGGGGANGDAGADPVLEMLARPHVQDALAAAAAAGYPIATETGSNPPAIGGYYVKPYGEGRFVASGNGDNLTSGVAGNEFRVTVEGDGSVTEAVVSFDSVQPLGSLVTSGLLLRGANSNFTLYRPYTNTCGTDLAIEGISITSGRFDAATGDWLSMRQILITVSASGTQTSTCDQNLAGNLEVAGGWIVAEVPRRQRITPALLLYMCVDESAGYVPGETWTRTDATPCSCSADFVVECG